MINLESLKQVRKTNRPDFVGIYLKGKNTIRFKSFCRKNNIPYSALINALIDKYFEEIYANEKD